jgi:hypothetical protein
MKTIKLALSVLLIAGVYELYGKYTVLEYPEKVAGNNIVTVYNTSAENFYIALVTTAKFSNNKKLYTNPAKKAVVRVLAANRSGTPTDIPAALGAHRHVIFKNFDQKLMTWNRVLLIARTKEDLEEVLNSGRIEGIGVYAKEIGSNKKLVLETYAATANGDSEVSFSFSSPIKNSASSFHKAAVVEWTTGT